MIEKKMICALLGIAMAIVASAPIAIAKTLELSPLEVRAPIVESERTTRFGGTVAEVGRDQILDLNADGMAESLRRVTGVNISRFNDVGSYGGADGGAFYIRGQGVSRPGSEIRIYVDGAPREVGLWQHSLLDIVNIAHADRILVYKGPQPQAYGGVFGAVDIETLRRRDPGYETGISLSAGSFSSYSLDFSHGGLQDGLDYYAGYSYAESDGHREHSAGEMESVFARLGYQLAEGLHAAYIFNATDNSAEDPGRADGPTPERDKYNTRTYDNVLRFDSHQDFGSGYLLAYYEDGEAIWEKDHLSGPQTPSGFSNSYWENYGIRSSHSYRIDSWEISGGVDWMSSGGEFENKTLSGKKVFGYDDRFETLAPALALLYDLDIGRGLALRPSAGLRWYDNNQFGDETAPHAALVLDGEHWSAHAAYSRGVHFPGVYAAGTSGKTLDRMSAEIMDHVEAGIALEALEDLRIRLTAFNDQSDDLLVSGPDGYLNVGDGRVKGVECGIDYLPQEWLGLYMGATFLDSAPDNYPRAPETSIVAAANLAPHDRWKISVDAQYVASQTVGNRRVAEADWSQFEEIDSYLLANAKVSYDIVANADRNVRIYTALENITDEDYEYWAAYPMPGINYAVGIESAF